MESFLPPRFFVSADEAFSDLKGVQPNEGERKTRLSAAEQIIILGGQGTPKSSGLGASGTIGVGVGVGGLSIAVGGSWTPLTPGTLIEWLKADSINQSNNTGVTTWPAAYGTAATTGPGTSGNPTFLTNFQNGLPGVSFNGTANGLSVPSFTGGVLTYPITIALAFKYLGGTGTTTNLFTGAALNFPMLVTLSNNFWVGFHDPSVAVDNNFHILFAEFDTSTTSFGFEGAALQSISGGGYQLNGIGLGYNANSQSTFSNVEIGEVIVWSGAGSSFYSQAYSYLNNRWS